MLLWQIFWTIKNERKNLLHEIKKKTQINLKIRGHVTLGVTNRVQLDCSLFKSQCKKCTAVDVFHFWKLICGMGFVMNWNWVNLCWVSKKKTLKAKITKDYNEIWLKCDFSSKFSCLFVFFFPSLHPWYSGLSYGSYKQGKKKETSAPACSFYSCRVQFCCEKTFASWLLTI